MYTSLFDVFSIGIGPSSSHTMGPMRAAHRFVSTLQEGGKLGEVRSVRVTLYGSLALTGEGHGTPKAIVYGLMGKEAETMEPSSEELEQVQREERLPLFGRQSIPFNPTQDIICEKGVTLPEHSNGMRFCARDVDRRVILEEVYFSIGGGAIRRRDEIGQSSTHPPQAPYPFRSCNDLISLCQREHLTIAGLIRCNESALRPLEEVRQRILLIHRTMQQGIERGIATVGTLPGSLKLARRAPLIYRRLEEKFHRNDMDALTIIDWINLWAFAVAEENAAGGRIVTAPTMGSAGIIPAVLRYYERYGCKESPVFDKEAGIEVFLLTASAICSLYRANASISGAEVGCQGEVGVACSMAAAGLTAAMGGSLGQIENAAEIAMEHNLGLTCDPICGLVQVPCIERNAIGAVKAVNAARLAMRGDGTHYVSLDSVIATMDETGRNLAAGYRETSLAGLAKNALTC